MIITLVKKYVSLYKLKKTWRAKNAHNETTIGLATDLNKISVGRFSYGQINAHTWGVKNEALKIGNYVSIGPSVTFILAGNHNIKGIATYPFHSKKYSLNPEKDAFSKGITEVGDNTWIGMGCIILSGVKIGKGCVIAAGSVVTKSMPDYTIVAGNPAQVVRNRFNEEDTEIALNIDFSEIDLLSLSDEQVKALYQTPTIESSNIIKK